MGGVFTLLASTPPGEAWASHREKDWSPYAGMGSHDKAPFICGQASLLNPREDLQGLLQPRKIVWHAGQD